MFCVTTATDTQLSPFLRRGTDKTYIQTSVVSPSVPIKTSSTILSLSGSSPTYGYGVLPDHKTSPKLILKFNDEIYEGVCTVSRPHFATRNNFKYFQISRLTTHRIYCLFWTLFKGLGRLPSVIRLWNACILDATVLVGYRYSFLLMINLTNFITSFSCSWRLHGLM